MSKKKRIPRIVHLENGFRKLSGEAGDKVVMVNDLRMVGLKHPECKKKTNENALKSVNRMIHGTPTVSPLKKRFFKKGEIIAPIVDYLDSRKQVGFKILKDDFGVDKILLRENILIPQFARYISGGKNINKILSVAVGANLLTEEEAKNLTLPMSTPMKRVKEIYEQIRVRQLKKNG